MKLELKNFRCIEHISIEIVDGELTLINGNNAAGKSTILDSISWILYGDTKRIFPKTKPKAKVEGNIYLNRVNIKRTANPKSLELKIKDKTFVGDEAKSYIEENFGKLNLWKVSSCVDNNDINNFLLSTNAQRMELLNSIAFGDSNPKDRLDKIEEEIKEVKSDIKSKEELVEERKKDYQKELKNYKNFNEENCRTKKEISEIQEKIDNLKEVIPNLRNLWNKYERSLGEYNKEKDNLRKLEEERTLLNKPEKIKKYAPSKDLNDNLLKLMNNETYKKRIKELNNLIKDVKLYKNDEKLLRETGTQLELIEREKSKCTVEYNKEAINNRISQLEKIISENKIRKNYKEYKTLYNELQKYFSYRYNYLNELKEKAELWDISQKLKQYEERMDKFDIYINILRREKNKYEKYRGKEEILLRSKKIKEYKELQKIIENGKKYNNYIKYQNFCSYKNYLINLEKIEKYNELKKIIRTEEYPNNIYNSLEEIQQIEENNNRIKTELPDLKNKILKKKCRIKDIEESLSVYNCPHCNTQLSLDSENGVLIIANGVKKCEKDVIEKFENELKELNNKHDNLKKQYVENLDELYTSYAQDKIKKLGKMNFEMKNVSIPVGYDESFIEQFKEEDDRGEKIDNIEELERNLMKLEIEIGDDKEDIILDTDIDIEEIKNKLDKINHILSRSSISMDDVEHMDVDTFNIEDIDINILESCRSDLAYMDELEEKIEGKEIPEEEPDLHIEEINKELDKIKETNIEIINYTKKIKVEKIDDKLVQMKHLEIKLKDVKFAEEPLNDEELKKELNQLKSIVVYDEPECDYEELNKSINARKHMEELKELKKKIEDIDDDNIPELKKRYESCKKYEDEIKHYETQMLYFEKKIKEIVITEPIKPEVILKDKEKELDELLEEMDLAIKSNAVNKVYKSLQKTEDELEDLQIILQNQLKIKELAIETQCNMLDNLINRINKHVNILLEKLLETPIVFEIKLFREMKTKKVFKQNVNIQIIDGPNVFDNINDMCGGEKSMICVALTLVFNSMLPTPLILFDETFAKMSEAWKEDAIDRIIENSMGKTVLCTIHGGTKGRYNNIINIPDTDIKYVKDKM